VHLGLIRREAQYHLPAGNALTASYALNADGGGTPVGYLTTSSFNIFTASYNTTSASFDTRIKTLSSSVAANQWRILSGSTQVATYSNDTIVVTGNVPVSFIVSGSGSFTGPVDALAFYQDSLRILKENIAPCTSCGVRGAPLSLIN
jgi:hypothetical protein